MEVGEEELKCRVTFLATLGGSGVLEACRGC